jgi:hypothetical protein
MGEKAGSRFVQALLVVAVAALVLAAGALPETTGSELEAPLLVAPAQGASFAGGTAIVFQVRTYPDDSQLLLNVSRSAAKSDCGTIGGEIAMKFLKPTSDGSLYQAAPTPVAGGWMDTPGTYYWQAYRFAGPDGCVESEVRSFTITPGPNRIPPLLLSPAPKQNVRMGTVLSFRIRTFAGDKSLSLRVSRSPTLDSSGRIQGEVQRDNFAATSDPNVYEAKPAHYAGDWMDTTGTYYWQASRYVSGAGIDGYITSDVHSFTIAYPPPRSRAAARLEGTFVMFLTVRATSGTKNLRRGQIYKVQWKFKPHCGKGSCRTTVDISALSSTLTRGTIDLKRKGAAYSKRRRAALFQCVVRPVSGPLKIKLRVKKGAWFENRWMAAQIAGSLRYAVAASNYGPYRCHAARVKASLRGWLLE